MDPKNEDKNWTNDGGIVLDTTDSVFAYPRLDSDRQKEFEARNAKLNEAIDLVPHLFVNGYGQPAYSLRIGEMVLLKKVHPDAKAPAQSHPGDAGFDLSSVEALVIPPGKFTAVRTGLTMAMQGQIELQIRPRSGLAAKYGVTVLNSVGTVDSNFRGEIKVLLINHGDKPFEIKVGDRIAQGVFSFLPTIVLEEVDELPTSERGEGGFGSTGVK